MPCFECGIPFGFVLPPQRHAFMVPFVDGMPWPVADLVCRRMGRPFGGSVGGPAG